MSGRSCACTSGQVQFRRPICRSGACELLLDTSAHQQVGGLVLIAKEQTTPYPATPITSKFQPQQFTETPCCFTSFYLLLTCFYASFFPFCHLSLPPLFLSFSRRLFALFSPWKSALFCRAKGTAQSWRRAVSGWTSPQTSGRKFLPEIRVKKGQLRF